MEHLRSMWRQASGQAWYHGTVADLEPGEVLVPGVSRNYRHSDPGAVSITSDYESAVYWAEQVSWKTGCPPVVYAVEPIGEVTPWRPGEARCLRAQVIRRVAKQVSGDVNFDSVSDRPFGRTRVQGASGWTGQPVEVMGRSFVLGDISGGNWYHGTSAALSRGDRLVPGKEKNFPQSDSSIVSITSDLSTANHWAREVAKKSGGNPRVYAVEPVGTIDIWKAGLAEMGKKICVFEGRVSSAIVVSEV